MDIDCTGIDYIDIDCVNVDYIGIDSMGINNVSANGLLGISRCYPNPPLG